MCMVSMVGTGWPNQFPKSIPYIPEALPAPTNWPQLLQNQEVSRTEFDAMKKELEAIKKVLIAAKLYDENTGAKDCEDPDKVALFKVLAKLLGVDMSDVFPEAASK